MSLRIVIRIPRKGWLQASTNVICWLRRSAMVWSVLFIIIIHLILIRKCFLCFFQVAESCKNFQILLFLSLEVQQLVCQRADFLSTSSFYRYDVISSVIKKSVCFRTVATFSPEIILVYTQYLSFILFSDKYHLYLFFQYFFSWVKRMTDFVKYIFTGDFKRDMKGSIL